MEYYPKTSAWKIPEDLLEVAIAEMKNDGENGNEGTCLWLGEKGDEFATISHTVFLRGPHIHKGPAQIQIAPHLMREVHVAARERGLVLIGQIHSHGKYYGIDLSHVDHECGFRIPSFLSVVAPDYGLTWPITWQDCGVHIFERGEGFVRIRGEEVTRRIVQTRSYPDSNDPMTDLIELSRPAATAAQFGVVAPDAGHFFKKPVLLTGEQDILATENGSSCFRSAVLLLLRMTENLTIDVSNHPSAEEVRKLVKEYGIHKIAIVEKKPDVEAFAAVLNIGAKTEPDHKLVAVNSSGWLFRVSSCGVPISADCSQYNPIGALAAASIGVSEIFKILIRLNPKRGDLLKGYSYSLWDYSLSDDPGPEIPDAVELPPTVLFGGGAIGNGIVYLLRDLVGSGTLTIVDREKFKKENLGTCLLLKPSDLDQPKSEVLCKELPFAHSFHGDVAKFKATLTEVPFVCINGLDNIEARRQVQEIWPDLIIDGAIGPTSCEATLHPWGPNLSCLLCDFEEPSVSAIKEASIVTGLTEARLQDQTAPVSEADVTIAPDNKKEWLHERIGQQICSVVSEGELAMLSREEFEKDFEPSVPFVACLSAAMVVAELMRYVQKSSPALETGFQFDVLVGPHNGIRKGHERKQTCLCVTRKALIEKLRARRLSS